MYDLVIKNATVIDGTRRPRFAADIAVKDGRIAKIGAVDADGARDVIDAEGRIVAPGHIDPHSHYDAQMFWDPTCADAGQNGSTTVISANCGFGFAPCRPEHRERYMLMMQHTEQVAVAQMKAGLPWDWESYPEFRQSVEKRDLAVNISLFVPLNPVLIYVMGIDRAKNERPTRAEMARIKQLIHEGMDAGAQGVSFVRLGEIDSHTDYDGSAMPTDMMHPDDAAEISSVLGERGQGVVMCLSQIGTMGDPAVTEQVARAAAGRPVVHNAIVATNESPEMHLDALKWLDRLRAEGLNIWGQAGVSRTWQEITPTDMAGGVLDFMPAARDFTGLHDIDEMIALASDDGYRQRFRGDYDPSIFEIFGGPMSEYIVVGMGDHADEKGYLGKTLAEIGELRGTDFVDAFFDLAIATRMTFTLKVPRGLLENPILAQPLVAHPHCLPGVSDGGAHSKFTSGASWTTDLLIWLAREEGMFTLEHLHHRLAGLPAEIFGLDDRGTIEEGKAADLLVYKLSELHFDRSSYEMAYDMPGGDWRRKTRSGGYRYIIVNGEVTWEKDKRTERHPGKLLRVGEPLPEQHLEAAE